MSIKKNLCAFSTNRENDTTEEVNIGKDDIRT